MVRDVQGLGKVEGISHAEFPNVEQYNGIPYGSIRARFRQAQLVNSWPEGKWDGTKYGPICPFPKMVIGHALTQCKLPPQHGYDMDEFKCLNLNVTCPKGSTAGDGLPVMVWIHGGGNVVGMGSDPGYNGAPLVEFSVQKGMPTIVVTINYRLGAFGFLASSDLETDNEAAGDFGCGNYGIRDQLLAFKWVKNNIKSFGGDPTRVTAVGHSAGSIDTHIAACSGLFAQQQPFHQAILQSGVASLTVRGLSHQQAIYNKITAHLKISETTSSNERLDALRNVSSEDLVSAYIALGGPISSWQATVDGYFLKEVPKVSRLSSIKYSTSLQRLLIGDCAEESRIFAPQIMAQKWTYEKVESMAITALGVENAQRTFKEYGITAVQDPQQFLASIFSLLNDAEWAQPIETVAKSFSNGDVFYYNIAELNPFDGPNKGTAHHGVDLLFTFLTYQKHLPALLAKQAEVVAEKWLAFIAGKDPWKSYAPKSDGSSTLMGFGHDGQHGEIAESVKPSYRTLRVCEAMQDQIGTLAANLRGEFIIE